MSKRVRPSPGYFANLNELDCNVSLRKRAVSKPELLDGYYFVERLLAKRRRDGEIQYLVKWLNWDIADSTWEITKYLPKSEIQAFEHPSPNPERVQDFTEELALLLEKGLKTGLKTTETMNVKHEVVRTLFKKMPSLITRKPYMASKQDFVDAGLEQHLERTITLSGAHLRIKFQVRQVQKLQIFFFKNHV